MLPEMTDESPTRMSCVSFALNANLTRPERRFWQKLNTQVQAFRREACFIRNNAHARRTGRGTLEKAEGRRKRKGKKRKAESGEAERARLQFRCYTFAQLVAKFPFNYYKRLNDIYAGRVCP